MAKEPTSQELQKTEGQENTNTETAKDPIEIPNEAGETEQKDNGGEYVAPTTQNVGTNLGNLSVPAAAPAAKPTEPVKINTQGENGTKDEASYEKTPDVVNVAEMVNAKGDLTTDVIADRIARHMLYLTDKRSFKDDKQRLQEQASFMETVGNSLQLPFPQHALVTDLLLNQIRENLEVFASGDAFKFMRELEKIRYPMESIRFYQRYITYLTKIIQHYKTPARLKTHVDLAYVADGLTRVAKENIQQYYTKVANR